MCENGASGSGKVMEERPVVFGFGDFEADEALRELRRQGRPVELHATPLRLLLYLLRNRDRVIPKDELLDRVWSDASVSEGALSTALNQIRSALGDDGSQQRVIQTLRGRGYRLIAPVEEHFAAAAARAHPARRSAPDFVGRGHILDQLDAALEDAQAGRGRIVLLAGEAGIGKTRTAEEFAADARSRGLPVHTARCREEKGAPPYWPWVQLLRGLVDGRDADALRSELGGGAARISRIVPEIRERLPDLPEAPTEADREEARFRLFDAIAGFLERASAAPGADPDGGRPPLGRRVLASAARVPDLRDRRNAGSASRQLPGLGGGSGSSAGGEPRRDGPRRCVHAVFTWKDSGPRRSGSWCTGSRTPIRPRTWSERCSRGRTAIPSSSVSC